MSNGQAEVATDKRSTRRGAPAKIDVRGVVEHLRKTYPEGSAWLDDAEVRNHSVTFATVKWAQQWAALPSATLVPAVLAEPAAQLQQSRQELFDTARKVRTEGDAVDLYVRVSGWGVANSARGRYRCLQVLRDPEAPRKLLDTAAAARYDDPVETFSRLSWGGDLKIKGYGPAFFTKWMYFTGYDSAAGTSPLILDQRVAGALGIESGYRWRRASSYRAYLEAVPRIRDEWKPDATDQVIEYALFQAGRQPWATGEGVNHD